MRLTHEIDRLTISSNTQCLAQCYNDTDRLTYAYKYIMLGVVKGTISKMAAFMIINLFSLVKISADERSRCW